MGENGRGKGQRQGEREKENVRDLVASCVYTIWRNFALITRRLREKRKMRLVDENIKINVAVRQISAAITLSRNDYFRLHNR